MKHSDAEGLVPVRRALVSVSDKTILVPFATRLVEHGIELISTGGTAKELRDAGLDVLDVSDVTGFPEMMAGRVKTLHPSIHGGLLGRLPEDQAVMAEHNIGPIDLVCVNLYPFEKAVAKPDATLAEAIENIDIGGPSMIRAAAKNHQRVAVVTRPDQYDTILAELAANGGATLSSTRARLAWQAFRQTSDYDNAISTFLQGKDEGSEEQRHPGRKKLRYGENPHQEAAVLPDQLRPEEASVAFATQHHGKELGYINMLDADAALNQVKEFDGPACCIVKHASPCGVGRGASAAEAFDRAYAGDPLAAFGGVLAMNQPVTLEAATSMVTGQKFLEVIVAPAFDRDALALLQERWKNVRLLEVGQVVQEGTNRERQWTHHIVGGQLQQDRDLIGVVEDEWKVVTDRQPTDQELEALRFNWLACKHVKSNAIVIGGEQGTYGIGGGQVDRVAAAEQAVKKAGDRAKGAVAASDAFFPFPDGPAALLDAGVTAIVQPGGSRNDQLTIDLCNEREATMIFTGRRHFRH